MRRHAPDLLIVLLLFLLPLFFFWPQTLGGRTLLPADNLFQWEPFASYRQQAGAPDVPHNALLSDLMLENYAWKRFLRESLASGELPLWNPYLFAGVPFLAAGQHSALYPLSVIYYVLPLSAAYGWFTVVQLGLAGVFMYAFARVLGQRRVGATVAALSWQLSGFMLVSVVFPMILGTVAWLPLPLLWTEFVLRARPVRGRPATLPWAALGAASLGVMIFAGHAEAAYLTLIVLGFYAAARLLTEGYARRRETGIWRWVVRRGVWLGAMVALGLALGAAQLLPMFELASVNFRQGRASFEQVLSWAYPWRRVIAFLMPNFFGNPSHHAYFDVFSGQTVPATVNALGQPINTIDWGLKNYVEGGAYLGILPLALAVFGLVAAWGNRRVRATYNRRLSGSPLQTPPYRGILATLALVSLTFIFGLPTYAAVYYLLPLLNQSHAPFRWVYPLTLSVAALAGFGADALAALTLNPSPSGRGTSKGEDSFLLPEGEGPEVRATWARRFGWVLVGSGVIVVAALLLSRLFYPQIEPLVERVFRGMARAEEAFADAAMFFSYQFANVLTLALFLVGSGAVFLLSRRALRLPLRLGRRPLWEALTVAVVVADLMIASWGFNPAVDPALLDFTPPAIAWLQERYAEEGPFRITSLDVGGQPGVMTANIPWLFGLEDVRGYDSMIPRQYTDYMALISPQVQLDFNRVAPLYADHLEALDSPLLDLLGVRYVVTTAEIERDGYALAWEDESSAVRIYENLDAMPRAFTAREISQEVASAATEWTAQPITEYRRIQITIEATISESSWLVLADSHFPGWRAFVRPQGAGEDFEQEVPVRLVNGIFRGVRLDPDALAAHYADLDEPPEISDTWTVRFRYSPPGFQVGAFVSFIAAVILIFGVGVWLWRTFYVESGEDDAAGMRRIAKNSVMPIVMNLFNKVIDFGLAFVMLRILGPTDAGIYYYAIVVFLWFDILTNFGLNTFLTREVARDHSRARHVLFNTSALRLGLAALGVPLLIAFLAARQATVSPPLEGTAIAAIGLFYVGLVPNSLSTGMSALFYAFEKAEVPAAISTVSTISKAVLSLSALLLGWGVVGLAGVSILTNLITLGVMLWAARGMIPYTDDTDTGTDSHGSKTQIHEKKSVKIRLIRVTHVPLDRLLLRHMIFESWPLMINHLLATVFYKINVVLLEGISGAAIVGKYSTAYKWLDALQVIPAFLTMALFPVLSRQAQDDLPAFTRSARLAIKLLVMVALPVAVATTFLAEALIGLLGGAAFLPEGGIALQIMIWSIPLGWINSVVQYVLIALDQQRIITRAFIVAVTFNIVANLIFLPRYGYPAAAVIAILSEGVLLVLFGTVLQRTLRARAKDQAIAEAIAVPWIEMLWRLAAAAATMFAAMILLWAVHPLLGLAAVIVYPLALIFLRPLDAVEQQQLAPLLPGRLRRRLGFLRPAAEPATEA